MRKTRLSLLALIFGWILAPGCKRATEEITSEPLSDYMPLEVGKYITYRLDSTVFTSFGTNVEIHSYQEKNVVDAQFKDLLDRPSYRVLRYLRDAAGTGPWTQAGSYYITPAGQTMEVIEHN